MSAVQSTPVSIRSTRPTHGEEITTLEPESLDQERVKEAVTKQVSSAVESSGGSAWEGDFPSGTLAANYYSDGYIGDFQQGGEGDCWFLAAVNALSQNAEGRKIIDDAIEEVRPGVYEVTFGKAAGGETHTYTVTQEEVLQARREGLDLGNGERSNRTSTGDFDLALLEIAAIKHYEAAGNGDKQVGNPMQEGGIAERALYLLTGYSEQDIDEISVNFDETGERNLTDAYLDKLANDPDGINVCVSINAESSSGKDRYAHALTLTDVDAENRTVTLENPWSAGKPIVLTYDQLQGEQPLSEDQKKSIYGRFDADSDLVNARGTMDNADLGEKPSPEVLRLLSTVLTALN